MTLQELRRSLALLGLGAAFALSPIHIATALAAEPLEIAQALPARVLSVVSGGYWEDSDQRGYYRAIAVRSADNTSRLYLQRIQLADSGPSLVDTNEIESMTEMKAYITDMRPETSTGIAQRPGFAVFVYLKLDPTAGEPDTYELFVDDFGDIAFTPASN